LNKNAKSFKSYSDDGVLVDSGKFIGLSSKEAKQKITTWLEEKKLGKRKINYKLQEWVFSRQRYWGEPIPIIHCEQCGVVAVPEEQLPVVLPEVEKYEPTGTGESPLASIEEWVITTCPQCGGKGKRETNTMPQWGGSSWYYLRYIDPKNNERFVGADKEKYWQPVDLYVGGAEHATRHLIYARFWHRFLFDIGAVSTPEPFKKLQHVGLVMAEDGRKMSKRWNNVINPDDIVERYGADALRAYEMFMGPFENAVAWSTQSLIGTRRFLEKIIKLESKVNLELKTDNKLNSLVHKTIKKVTEDIENLKFNTAISTLMILVNEMEKQDNLSITIYQSLITLVSPFAPHLAEELWEKLGNKESIFKAEWPKYDENLIKDEEIELIIQINGKVRDKVMVPSGISEDEAKKIALSSEKIIKWLEGKEPKKIIFIQGKLVSIFV
jgi:leucyl-tRNA synthetase